jgi:hypothetical protein
VFETVDAALLPGKRAGEVLGTQGEKKMAVYYNVTGGCQWLPGWES